MPAAPIHLLPNDRYVSLPPLPAAFSSMMEGALTCWRAAGRRGIWLSVPLARAELIAPAVALGFAFHHAEPTHLMVRVKHACAAPGWRLHSRLRASPVPALRPRAAPALDD